MSFCLKTYAVNSGIDQWLSDDLSNHIGQFSILREINGFTAKAACLCQPFFIHVANDDNGSAKQLCRSSTCQANRPCTRDIDGRTRCHASSDSTMIACGENVREHSEVKDFLHCLVLVGKLQQVPVGIGNHD